MVYGLTEVVWERMVYTSNGAVGIRRQGEVSRPQTNQRGDESLPLCLERKGCTNFAGLLDLLYSVHIVQQLALVPRLSRCSR